MINRENGAKTCAMAALLAASVAMARRTVAARQVWHVPAIARTSSALSSTASGVAPVEH